MCSELQFLRVSSPNIYIYHCLTVFMIKKKQPWRRLLSKTFVWYSLKSLKSLCNLHAGYTLTRKTFRCKANIKGLELLCLNACLHVFVTSEINGIGFHSRALIQICINIGITVHAHLWPGLNECLCSPILQHHAISGLMCLWIVSWSGCCR